MQFTVLVEPLPNQGFRAKSGEPLALSAEGATPDEAVDNLRIAMNRQLKNGSQLRCVEFATDNPWLALAGTHDAADPLLQEWKGEIAAYRREVESDPDRP